MTVKYPYARPAADEATIASVVDVLSGRHWTQGPQLPAFEAEFAATCGAPHVIACANGTAALHLAYLAAGLGPEHGLLTSPITFLATANAARMCGAPVVFADVDPATGNLDPASVRDTLRDSSTPIRAIAAVHLGGRACDLGALRDIADEFGCLVIEDACHAPGAYYRDAGGARHPVGSCAHSEFATFSFHAIKHIAMGEGGAVCAANGAAAAHLRRLRAHGLSRDPASWQAPPEAEAPWYYEMHELGYNYRLSDIQCALGRGQLAGLPGNIARRRRLAGLYTTALDGVAGITPPPAPPHEDEHAWHLYAPAFDFAALGKARGAVMQALAARGVETQVHYIPIYRQPYYRGGGGGSLPGAEDYYRRTLSLPLYPQLDDGDVAEIVAAIKEVCA